MKVNFGVAKLRNYQEKEYNLICGDLRVGV